MVVETRVIRMAPLRINSAPSRLHFGPLRIQPGAKDAELRPTIDSPREPDSDATIRNGLQLLSSGIPHSAGSIVRPSRSCDIVAYAFGFHAPGRTRENEPLGQIN